MFLKSLEIFGFKSFPDKTRLEFADGITCLLGPNGCGKSNIVDSIKWVLGEQSTKTLRAGRMEDVIFNGTDTRKPLNVAEVTLVLCNENHFLPMDNAEIEIKRRIYRTGESEYYINRNRVLLKNVRELFFDTGVGKSAYSILEQGKIDQILSSKPEDRRYIFEEAAGISRFKAQSIEAERKLERTAENIEQVENILKEVKRTYDSRKAQAAKASSYRELVKEQFSLEVDVQLSTLKTYLMVRDHKTAQLEQARRDLTALQESLKQYDEDIEREQEAMRQRATSRINIQTKLQRLDEAQKGKNDQLELLTQRFRDFCHARDEAAGRADQILERINRDQAEIDELHGRIDEFETKKASLEREVAGFTANLTSTQELINRQEQEISDRELDTIEQERHQTELTEELKSITDVIVVELEQKLKESGYSTKVRKEAEKAFLDRIARLSTALAEHIDFIRKLKTATGISAAQVLAEQERRFETFQDGVEELKSLFQEYCGTVPTFIDEFLAPEGIITRKHAVDRHLDDSRTKVARNRDRINLLREENRNLSVQVENFRVHLEELRLMLGDLASKREAAQNSIEMLQRSMTEAKYQHGDAVREHQLAQERIADTQENIRAVQTEQKQIAQEVGDLNSQLEALVEEIEQQSASIGNKREAKTEAFNRLQDLRSSSDKLEFQIESMGEEIKKLYTNFFDTYGKSLKEYEHRLDEELNDLPVLKTRLDEVKKQIQGMGYINHMAEDEFAEVKERYDFLTKQLDDLNKAKNDLEQVVMEIKTRSEQLFLESYRQISENFQEMFRRLFGGGRAELKLVDPENVLTTGIDILAQPPGKKLTHLALLSGGERSMTAVGMLFATYMVKPSPFCILDEIDAALDDRNIGYFLSVLQDFAEKSQFIIITHNKHTVMGSQTLLGVTQQEAGVSTTVSYKIGNEKGAPVILNQDDSVLDSKQTKGLFD
ncbi:MAG: AAA family ATPase [Sphaerochaetaceae bacterium]